MLTTWLWRKFVKVWIFDEQITLFYSIKFICIFHWPQLKKVLAGKLTICKQYDINDVHAMDEVYCSIKLL
jgi:hypothetical protein